MIRKDQKTWEAAKSVVRRIFMMLCVSCILLSGTTDGYTEEIGKQLFKNAQKTYKKALYIACREDFKGVCGMCVGYQLMAVGIYDRLVMADGNNCYDLYSETDPTDGFISVCCPGPYKKGEYGLADVLGLLDEKNKDGQNTYAVFCFNTGSYGPGQMYGHVLLVHSVYEGQVVWCDSKNGKALTGTIAEFVKRYRDNEYVYHFDGAILFEPCSEDNILILSDSDTTESDADQRFQ